MAIITTGGYVAHKERGKSIINNYIDRMRHRDWFLVKYNGTKSTGKINVGQIVTPPEFVGKKIKLKVEIVEERDYKLHEKEIINYIEHYEYKQNNLSMVNGASVSVANLRMDDNDENILLADVTLIYDMDQKTTTYTGCEYKLNKILKEINVL